MLRVFFFICEVSRPSILEEYKHTSNRVRKQTRANNKEEQLKIAKNCETNPNKFCNYTKSKTNSKDKIGDLVIVEETRPDRVISDNQEKANILCDYFSSVFNKDAGKEDLYMVQTNVTIKWKVFQ